jgi:hypothetical protein
MELKYPDGQYRYEQIEFALESDFTSEKDLSDYIELNIDLFTKECLNYEYKSHQREYQLSMFKAGTNRRNIKGNRRLDFVINTTCGKIIGIECKHPTYKSELTAAVGQCLGYMAIFEEYHFKLDTIIIVSSKVDHVLPMIINKFNLPIGYISMDKSKHLTYKGYGQNGQ